MAEDIKGLAEHIEDAVEGVDFGDVDDFADDGPEPMFDDTGDPEEPEQDDTGDVEDEPEDDSADDGDGEGEEEEVDPLAEFAKTGDPSKLPDGEFKDRISALMQQAEQATKQLEEARKIIDVLANRQESAKGGEGQAADEEPMPEVDLTADEDTISKQIAEVAAWAARREAKRIEREMEDLKKYQAVQKQQEVIAELENYVRSLEGYTPEIEEKMGQFMQQHADDPEWRQLFATKAGLKLIFDNVRGVYATAAAQDEAAKRALKAKKASQPRMKSRKAEGMDPRERFKGLKPEQKVEKAVQEALARASEGAA